jgi:ribosomal protein L20
MAAQRNIVQAKGYFGRRRRKTKTAIPVVFAAWLDAKPYNPPR